jgi:hypothetical protein
MLDHNHTTEATSTEATVPTAAVEAAAPSWSAEVEALLVKAAELCAANEVDPEAFMQAAWSACLASRPGLREHLAELELMARVTALRERGMVGSA